MRNDAFTGQPCIIEFDLFEIQRAFLGEKWNGFLGR